MGRTSRSGLVGLLMAGCGRHLRPATADPSRADVLAEPLTSMVEVRQSGGFDPFTLSLIDDAVRAVRGESTELHRVTLRMLRVTRGDEVIQEAPAGFRLSDADDWQSTRPLRWCRSDLRTTS